MGGVEPSLLALMAAVGAALLLLGLLAAVGGRRTVAVVRGLGIGGILLAVFVGAAVESLSASLAEAPPYTLALLPTRVLRVQALAEDPDLRTRFNVDSRLRYLPTGGERVADLEEAYAYGGGLRRVEVPPVRHSVARRRPAGLAALGEAEVEQEVEGLYDRAWETVRDAGREPELQPSRDRLAFASTASVGLLVVGFVGLVGGLVPLVGRWLALGYDAARLFRATGHASYRGARGRAVRAGTRGLAAWHGERGRPHLSLAALGGLTILAGFLMGLLREEETRRLAHGVFAEARHLRIEAKRP